jgi:geranylgeranyl pyrophosphate synthase
LETLGAEDHAELVAILSRSGNHHHEALQPWFARCDAIAYARQTALRFIRQAADELAVLPATPASESLRGLSDFVISRRQ